MDDFKIITRLLAAIRAGEDETVFPLALISEGALHTTEQRRDSLARKLQKAGLHNWNIAYSYRVPGSVFDLSRAEIINKDDCRK